ncbi:hypothetical protein PaeBR_11665 [Paenibacillus sp. BR2-3]|uniref:hypothetical protein n=1 Tax=Paenibacillus sp. BR2-3 TaxID=3048494 RepID=UPI003977BBAD
MRNNYKPVLAAVVLSMVLLVGCTELPGKADSNPGQNTAEEVVQQDFGAALQQKIGEATANIEQNVENAVDQVTESVKSKGVSEQLSVSEEIGSSSVLDIDNPVGEIKVLPASGNQMTVNATLWFKNNPSHEDDRQQILDNAEVSIQIAGDEVKVSTYAKDDPQKDIWSWAQDKVDYSDFSVDYVIEVPDGVDTFQITNNVGEVNLRDLKGTYRIVSNIGAVNISGAEVTGKSTVETNTGSIHLEIAGMSADSSLKAKTDIGGLTAVLDDSLKCSLETKSELGAITGAPGGKSIINGGGPLLSLFSSVGSITINK